jgi:ribosomal protein S18 acetylase RimI-like enzyme
VGRFGLCAVHPNYQGRGLGKKLITASLKYLENNPNRLIGLETMPESSLNLNLYLKLSFQARFSKLMMIKELGLSLGGSHLLPNW